MCLCEGDSEKVCVRDTKREDVPVYGVRMLLCDRPSLRHILRCIGGLQSYGDHQIEPKGRGGGDEREG